MKLRLCIMVAALSISSGSFDSSSFSFSSFLASSSFFFCSSVDKHFIHSLNAYDIKKFASFVSFN